MKKTAEPATMTVVVNGKDWVWHGVGSIDYDHVVRLADMPGSSHVTRCQVGKRASTMAPGDTVEVEDGMRFTVHAVRGKR